MASKSSVKTLLVGSDQFVNKRLDAICASLSDCERHTYFAEDIDGAEKQSEFFSAFLSVSLFDEGKLFIIRHAEKLKGTDKFLANTSRSNTSSIIIISTDVAASKQLQTAASDAGFTLEAESARREEDSNFSFVNAFLAKDRKKCAEIAAKLGEHKDGERAFYLLTSYIAGLYFKLALPKLYTANNPFFKGKSYFMQSVNNYANRWKAEETVGIINTMLEIDTDLKTGKIAPEYMLTNLLGYCASSM